MTEIENIVFEDLKDLTEKSNQIMLAAKMDVLHLNNPKQQIKTLGLRVTALLEHNEIGENDGLIGLYVNIGRSLKQLIKLQTNSNR